MVMWKNKIVHKVVYLLLSFFIPMLIMVLGLIALHITPFGDNTLAISDGSTYLCGLSTISRLLHGDGNIFYSFEVGLGGNELSSLAWGWFNPVFALSYFSTLETLPVFFTWISVINMALAGLTMYILLAYINGHKLSNLIFSTSYSLIGFLVVNDFQIIFFLGVQVLPIMALGLYRLMRGKSPVLYVLSLAYCIFANFYFGYMLCVASVLFFVSYMIAENKNLIGKRKKIILNYSISSVVSGLLAAFIWLPTLKAYSSGGRLDQATVSEFTFSQNMPFLQIFAKLFTGANSTSEIVDGLPNIFCGILVVALVILFFMNKEILKRRKIIVGSLIAFYLLSFYIVAFSMAMHGFTHTNWFPFRYSFVFSFILIVIAAEEFNYLDRLSLAEVKKAGVIILLSTVVIFATQYEFMQGYEVLIDFALLLLIGLSFWLYKTKPSQAPKRVFALLLLILASINLYANYVISTYKMMDYALSEQEYDDDIIIKGALTEALQTTDIGFYRIVDENDFTGSLGCGSYLYNYDSVSRSSPCERNFIRENLYRFGINWFDMRYYYAEGITAATDSFLGVKYVLSTNDLDEEKGYLNRVTLGDCSVYENPYVLKPAILSDIEVNEMTLTNDAFENLNNVWKAMSGSDKQIFTEENDIHFTTHNTNDSLTISSEDIRQSISVSEDAAENDTEQEYSTNTYIEYTFTAKQDGPIYVYDTTGYDTGYGSMDPEINCIGTFSKGDTVTDTFYSDGDYLTKDYLEYLCSHLIFAYADNNALAEMSEELQNRDITVSKEKANLLTGTLTADSNECILFTVPWDEGWTCYVDGEQVEINKTCDLFMSVNVSAGTHTYEMRFFPAWMNYGIIISLAALAAFVVYLVIWNILQRKRRKLISSEDLSGSGSSEDMSDRIEPVEVSTEVDETSTEVDSASAEYVETDTEVPMPEVVKDHEIPESMI